jgi:hypothetical protein
MTAQDGADAVDNGHAVTSYASGMCQQFVRGQCWEVPSLYGSAIEAWNGAREKHAGDRTPPNGAPVYYRGGQYGHAVMYCHGGIRSTDCQSGGRVSDTDLDWPVRNWGYEYLGWTGDINGVDLPLGSGGTDEPKDDDMPEYVHTTLNGKTFQADQWTFLEWESVVADTTGKAAEKGEAGIRIGGKRYTATLHATVTVDAGERIASRASESEPDGSGGYVLAETNATVEHLRTDGGTYIQDTRTGSVRKDGRLRFELMLPVKGTVDHADLVVLYW